MSKLVKLWKRPCKNGQEYKFSLIYYDEHGKRRQKALGHANKRKAEKQATQLERELRMGVVEPSSMRLSKFLADSLARTRGRVRETTLREYNNSMKHFIKVVGDIDYQKVEHKHGERFMQVCFDEGNSPATASKKLGKLKRLFQMAVERRQLDDNPMRYVKHPKVPRRIVRVYDDKEVVAMVRVAQSANVGDNFQWDLFILMAYCTGMRRGELLNLTWADIDFAKQIAMVSPKENSEFTWEWHIKDTDRRELPLTEDLIKLLVEHQVVQPEGQPYVFIPPDRYERIQGMRQCGNWSPYKANYPVNNFDRQFRMIRQAANIDKGQFHDFRRTCISNWLKHGLKEFDVMKMAGHANFETTRRFYLAVSSDLVDRARVASSKALDGIFVAKLLQKHS